MWKNTTVFNTPVQRLTYGDDVELRVRHDPESGKWRTIATYWTRIDLKLTADGPWCDDAVLSAITALGDIIDDCDRRRFGHVAASEALDNIGGMIEVMK